MPAEVVIGRFCADAFSQFNVPGSKPGTTYRVSLGGTASHCTCPAFMFFKGAEYDRSCKHIEYVWQHACLWNEQWYDGGADDLDPIPDSCSESGRFFVDQVCPHCGGPVVPVKIAV